MTKLKIIDKKKNELGYLAFEKNKDNFITLAKENDESTIDFEVDDSNGDCSIYSFSNEVTGKNPLYLDIKIKDGSRRIFGNSTKLGSVGWKLENHGSRDYVRMWVGTPYAPGVGSKLVKYTLRLGGKDGGKKLMGALDGGYCVVPVK